MSEHTAPASSSSPEVGLHPSPSASAFFYKAGMIEKLYGKQWIRKYAVLEGPFVHIFKKASSAQSAQGSATTPRARVTNSQLTSGTSGAVASAEQSISLKFVAQLAVAIRKDGGRSFFFVSNFDGTSHCFAADSVAELGPWVESITKALEYYNPEAVVTRVAPKAAEKSGDGDDEGEKDKEAKKPAKAEKEEERKEEKPKEKKSGSKGEKKGKERTHKKSHRKVKVAPFDGEEPEEPKNGAKPSAL